MSPFGYSPIAPGPQARGGRDLISALDLMSQNYRSRLPGLSWPDLPQSQPSLRHFQKAGKAKQCRAVCGKLADVWLMLIAPLERLQDREPVTSCACGQHI